MEEEGKRRLKYLLPDLVNEVSPSEILPYLTCLSDMARQQIVNCEKRESSHDAMMTLYQHLIRRNKGFAELEVALRNTDKEDLAHRLIGETGSEHHFEETSRSTRISPGKVTRKTDETIVDQKKKTEIGHNTYIRDLNVCAFKILDQLDYSGQENWESLAGHLGLSFRQSQKIKHDASSGHGEGCTRILVDQFIEITLGELLCILRIKMRRNDIVKQLEDFTGYRLPNDDMDGKLGENTQPTLQIQEENINTSYKKEQAMDKDISKAIRRIAKANDSIIDDNTCKNIQLPRITQKSHIDKLFLDNYPVQINCRDNDCMLKNQVEIDGLDTSGEASKPFSCIDNTEVSSVEKARLYAREEASLATDGCDANELQEYNAQHPRTDQFNRKEINSPSPVPSGFPMDYYHANANTSKFSSVTAESKDDNDETTMISIGVPRSVHHYDRRETEMRSGETFDVFGDKLDPENILSNNEEDIDKQMHDFKMIPETNEIRLEQAIVIELDEENIGGDIHNERNLDFKLTDAPPKAGSQQLPNWDMLHSENSTLMNTDYEDSTVSLDNSKSSNDLAFLKEIDPNTVEMRTVTSNSVDECSLPIGSIDSDDKHTQSDSSQNKVLVRNASNQVFNTCHDDDKEYASQNNNLERAKDNYSKCEFKNIEDTNKDNFYGEKKKQIDGDRKSVLLRERANCLSSNVTEQNSGSIRFVRNSLFLAGGAVLATLAYKSLKS